MIKKLIGLLERGRTMTAGDAKQALEEGAVLVDVREADEWRAGHAADAVHIPLKQLGGRLAELPSDRKMIMVCRSGRRSGVAVLLLRRHGLRAANLEGGMNAWANAGLPVVTDGGAPGRVA